MRLSGFEPIVDGDCRVLVLGTMPGVASLQKQPYYGHPRTAFWPILAALTEEALPEEYQARKLMLLRHGIALWDVCQSCAPDAALYHAAAVCGCAAVTHPPEIARRNG